MTEVDIVAVWFGIHNNAAHPPEFADILPILNSKVDMDQSDLSLLKTLNVIEAKRWIMLGNAAGWTAYGAVALSWCKDAKLEDVWAYWEASGTPLRPTSEYERPAKFINPAILSETRSLKELHEAADHNPLALCAMIAAGAKPLEFDFSNDILAGAKPQVAAFLKSRMERLPNRTREQDELINIWSERVKGTVYDVWTNPVETG